MTRDEAIKIVARGALPTDELTLSPSSLVDILRYLGVLKIDEPKSINQRIKENWSLRESYLPDFLTRLDVAGLKIVEK